MNIKDNKIEFEVDEKTMNAFKSSITLLEMDPDELFKQWTQELMTKATNFYVSGTAPSINDPFTKQKHYGQMWSNKRNGIYYWIIISYFCTRDEKTKKAKKSDMETFFNTKSDYANQVSTNLGLFLQNFRLLCSESVTGYGRFFEYDKRNELVWIRKELAGFMESSYDHYLEIKEVDLSE